MGFAFAKAAARIESTLGDDMGSYSRTVSPTPTDRPVIPQADVQTDGLDPAAGGGPAPMNSGQGPYGAPVTTDPMLQHPINPGGPVPYTPGPDVDTTTLH